MKTQEEYALEIDEIVRRDVESRQSDWFKIDKEIFMQPENKNKAFILGTRKTGCDLNTARKIKSGEIEGSVLIGNIKIEFVYESKDCADRYNLLFVKKDESGISAIYADTEGHTFFNNDLELEVEAGAYFKKGDVLISTLGNPFIYNGIQKCACGAVTIRFDNDR